MAKKTFQSISIRLLRDGVPPADSLRSGLTLSAWPKLENSLISLGTSKAQIPKWAPFLELADEDLTRLKNMMAFGLLFLFRLRKDGSQFHLVVAIPSSIPMPLSMISD